MSLISPVILSHPEPERKKQRSEKAGGTEEKGKKEGSRIFTQKEGVRIIFSEVNGGSAFSRLLPERDKGSPKKGCPDNHEEKEGRSDAAGKKTGDAVWRIMISSLWEREPAEYF